MENFINGDDGLLLNKIEESDLNGNDVHGNISIVEKIFSNNNSNHKIYYIGAEYRGEGIFYVIDNEKKKIILETHIRYGPKLYWHGENIVEIIIPTGSPFTHSYFYDFDDNKISSPYYFPLYYDIDNKIVLVWGDLDFELYYIKTNEIINEYNVRRINGLTSAWPYIQYYIEKEKGNIVIYYNDEYSNIKGKMILEIKKKDKQRITNVTNLGHYALCMYSDRESLC